MFTIFDNVLSPQECNDLIRLYEKNTHNSHEWRDTKPLNLEYINVKLVFDSCLKLYNLCKTVNPYIYFEWGEIVKWNIGASQPLHLDTASDGTVLTSITYLNDDYFGGNTYFFDGQAIQPKIGRTVIFDGKSHLHGVTPVEKNYRYTLPIWYKRM